MADINAPEGSVKWETRHQINQWGNEANQCFTNEPNIRNYESGHKKVDWIVAQLCGYIFSPLAKAKFAEMRNAFEEKKSKLKPSVRRNKTSEYLDLIYSYNLKRFELVRDFMSKAGLELYKKKVRARL